MLNVFSLAILHHVAAFTLVGAMAAEYALFRLPLDAPTVRRILRIDMILGLSAGSLLLIGLVRMTYGKGLLYYFYNWILLTKLALFLIASMISIYPTKTYFAWSRSIRRGQPLDIPLNLFRRVRLCLLLELACVVGVLICAPLMARGLGYFGD